MSKRTASGVVLAQQAASALETFQSTPGPLALNGPQLAVPVLPPPHAPTIVYPWAVPGSPQQEPSQQGPSALDLETEIEVALGSAGAAAAAGPSNSGQAQEGQDAGLVVVDDQAPMSEDSADTSNRTEPTEDELPKSAKGSVQPVGGPAEGM